MRHQYLLIRRLGVLLQTRMTGAGHLAQVVTQEHRGGCTPRECSPACEAARQFMLEVAPYLPQEEPRAPARMTRSRRAVPGRVLPSGPARASREASL